LDFTGHIYFYGEEEKREKRRREGRGKGKGEEEGGEAERGKEMGELERIRKGREGQPLNSHFWLRHCLHERPYPLNILDWMA